MKKIIEKSILFALLVVLPLNAEQKKPQGDMAYLFAHGLGGNADCKSYYIAHNIIPKEYHCYAFNGPEVMYNSVDADKVVLGQEDDIGVIESGIQAIKKDCPDARIIGVGVSKGAATLINAVAHTKSPLIKALILDSPFADANEVGYNVGKNFGIDFVPGGFESVKFVMENIKFKKYKANGIQPILSASDLPNVPILLMHSQQDKLIPINHARRLYKTLLKQGRTNVYLVEGQTGEHGNLLSIHNKARITFIKAVNAFYQNYNLPHDHDLAKGIDLVVYQPTLDEIERKIGAKDSCS